MLLLFNSGDFVITEFATVVYMYQCCKGNPCAQKEIHNTFVKLDRNIYDWCGSRTKADIVVWFDILVGQSVMFLYVYHANHLRLKSLPLFSYRSILTLDGSKVRHVM